MHIVTDGQMQPQAGFTNASLMAWLGITEGEVLEFLEVHGPTSLYRLIQALDHPASTVIMAVGALIREGLIKGSEQRLEYVGSGEGVWW